MAECSACGSYTKYNGGLCSKCFTGQLDGKSEVSVPSANNSGLSERDRNFRYGMIKGRIAETLIQELFLSLGYNVFRYGMENTIPGIMELLKGVRSDVAEDIKRMPDFVIQNPNTKDVHFIEVKFRANGCFSQKDLAKNYPYTNAYIVLVSKKHIKCITVEELLEGKEIHEKSNNYLGSRKEFDVDKEIIIEFCKFAIQFFESV
ncbi:hypothetical protein [Flavihumibacter profundi]|uniref:hypothetical protein n=1 Tax=Flavihumibacter profundi TaxID=2716883 RepID=UPI001CC3B6DD|nr:hypothetical protein [Flavihumibacter profundi]MBZ5857583.1 hypothetical protein [Flavihumibacter profundi]